MSKIVVAKKDSEHVVFDDITGSLEFLGGDEIQGGYSCIDAALDDLRDDPEMLVLLP